MHVRYRHVLVAAEFVAWACMAVVLVLSLVLAVVGIVPGWAAAVLVAPVLFAAALFAFDGRWRRRLRRRAHGPDADQLYLILERAADRLAGESIVAGSGDEAVHIRVTGGRRTSLTRMCRADFDHHAGLATIEVFTLLPYRPVVLHRVVASRFETDDRGGVVLLDEDQGEKVSDAVRRAARTGLGVPTPAELRELVGQVLGGHRVSTG